MAAMRLLLTALALVGCFSLTSALPRTPRSTSALYPHHLRIAHLLSDTHPDLVVDSVHPHFTWQLADERADDSSVLRGITQAAYQLQLLTASADGAFAMESDLADTGRVQSNASTQVLHPLALKPMTRYLVRVKYWSSTGAESEWQIGGFRTAMMDTWRAIPAAWIGSTIIPMHQLRKDFRLPLAKPGSPDSAVVSATVQMSGIGYSTLYLNGEAVDPTRKLDPGWTTYEKRTLYVSFDVQPMLLSGVNAIAVELGNGWYSQEQYISGTEEDSYGPPRLWFWLTALLADNTTINVYSDPTWMGATGPTIHDGVYMGSILDNRWLRPNWAKAGPLDPFTLWVNASVLPSPLASDGVLSLQIMDPIRTAPNNLHVATSAGAFPGQPSQPAGVIGGDLVKDNGGVLTPVELPNGVEGQPQDMGQNMAGWCRFTATGKRGMSLMVRYSETMTLTSNPQVAASLYTENLRDAASTDWFIFSKDDEPRDVRAALHGARLPLPGVPWREARDQGQRRAVLLRALRDDAGGQLHHQQHRHEPDPAQHTVGPAQQPHVPPQRLPAARRAQGLDGRRGADGGRVPVQLRLGVLLHQLPRPHPRHAGQRWIAHRHRPAVLRQPAGRPQLGNWSAHHSCGRVLFASFSPSHTRLTLRRVTAVSGSLPADRVDLLPALRRRHRPPGPLRRRQGLGGVPAPLVQQRRNQRSALPHRSSRPRCCM